MCSVSQKGGDVLLCVQVLHAPGAVHAAVWQTALQESGGQWTGAGFVSHRVLSVKTWCFFGGGGAGGGGLFPMVAFAHAQYLFLWLLLWYNCLTKSLFKSFSYFLVLCFWSGHYFLTKSCSNCYFVVVVLCLLLSSFFLLSLQQPC